MPAPPEAPQPGPQVTGQPPSPPLLPISAKGRWRRSPHQEALRGRAGAGKWLPSPWDPGVQAWAGAGAAAVAEGEATRPRPGCTGSVAAAGRPLPSPPQAGGLLGHSAFKQGDLIQVHHGYCPRITSVRPPWSRGKTTTFRGRPLRLETEPEASRYGPRADRPCPHGAAGGGVGGVREGDTREPQH